MGTSKYVTYFSTNSYNEFIINNVAAVMGGVNDFVTTEQMPLNITWWSREEA